jgi:galactonate dehydratase
VKGKALGVPVYELLGGKFRDEIRVYADCQVEPGMDFDDIKRVVDGALERGFTALKVDLDMFAYGHVGREVEGFRKDRFNHTAGPWEHDRMVRLVELVRDAAGKNIDVAADVHTRLDVPSAIRLAKDLEQFHLLWLEEPVPPENVEAMREVKRSTTTPICAGENLYLRHGFRDLVVSQAVDMIMPDIPKCGGLSECRKIANLAEIYYLPFAPHNVSSPIGTMASAHVCATVANFLVLEFHWLDRDYWTTIITDKDDIIDKGTITLTDRPGIGLELDETVARAHQYPGTTWFEQ